MKLVFCQYLKHKTKGNSFRKKKKSEVELYPRPAFLAESRKEGSRISISKLYHSLDSSKIVKKVTDLLVKSILYEDYAFIIVKVTIKNSMDCHRLTGSTRNDNN